MSNETRTWFVRLRLAAALFLATAGPAQTTRWLRARLPLPTANADMVYDDARQRVVLFSGNTTLPLGETWEWVGTSWTRRIPATNPTARSNQAMAYDAARRRVILFGGFDHILSTPLADTWEWDGVNWTRRSPATSPPARGDHAMAYDAARQRVVLYGGLGATLLGDTWEWDGTNWSEINPATNPGTLRWHAMAYDAARQRVVLFGGARFAGFVTETWTWDGVNWVQRVSATSPSGRNSPAMAYDATRQRVVLFAGLAPMPIGDTWEWDGSSWTQASPAASPPVRGNHAMAWDGARQRVLVFGGDGPDYATRSYADTWDWDGVTWTRSTPGASPTGRMDLAMAHDVARQKTVLFGGALIPTALFGDTWECDGAAWTQRGPVTSPRARYGHAMAYDTARQRVVLFGGSDNASNRLADTWEWDGSSWILRMPATSPTARKQHAMAYDVARQRVVLFGGWDAGERADTWEWDGTNWTQLFPVASPPARSEHAMAWDAARQRIVLFGGVGATGFRDTWEWDGASWTLGSSAGPSSRVGPAMACDEARRRVVLFGGRDYPSSMLLADTWEWDGSTWTQQNAAAELPQARKGHAMVYDAARQRILMFGGGDVPVLGDTWLHGGLAAAAVQTIGNACPGTHGPPSLTTGIPYLGNQGFALDLAPTPSSAPCLLMLASGTQILQLGGGCTLYLNGVLLPFATIANASGRADVRLQIPLDPSLRGAVLYAQGFLVDPMGPFAGLAFSAGVRLTLGD